jgi:hypothetical protein
MLANGCHRVSAPGGEPVPSGWVDPDWPVAVLNGDLLERGDWENRT